MTDPLEDLRRAFESATPAPDARRRQANLSMALKGFDHAKEIAAVPRPTHDRLLKWRSVRHGVGKMLARLTARPSLTAATVLAALVLLALVPTLREHPVPLSSPDAAPWPNSDTSNRTEPSGTDPADHAGGEAVATASPSPFLALSDEILAESSESLMELTGPAAIRMRAASDQPNATMRPEEVLREEFANRDSGTLKITADDPVSTLSIDVDTASYSVVRSSLMSGQLPPAEAVRIEEMVNYFLYSYDVPERTDPPFKPAAAVISTPWNPHTQLIHIALQGRMPATKNRPPLNLVFLIDTSGSMDDPRKLPLLVQSFGLLLGELQPEDEIAIATYAGSAGLVLDRTPASDRTTILGALDRLHAGGSTAGAKGLQLAYRAAEEMAADGEVTRVILATDGDFNVGISDPEALEAFIARKRSSGIYLSVLGFGRGNLDDATMQALAQNGNGQAAYIDTLAEAHKVLVDQLSGALFPIANDVKIQVEFNPATVAEYRLIGYETRTLRREDFNNDRIDAGEIGAGHSVTALYEITPVDSPAVLSEPLRYASPGTTPEGAAGELAFLRLRYKEPGQGASQLIELPITPGTGEVNEDIGFAAAIAGFGQLLRRGAYIGDWTFADAIALGEANLGIDSFGYRREAVTLMRLAERLTP